MEDNAIERLEGLRSEDLATEGLAAILSSSNFVEIQKLFYELVLRDGKLCGTDGRQIEISTQASDEQGRPDLEARSEKLHILIENKFSAMFSGGDQLLRYVEILRKSESESRVLILLCPRYSLERYEHQTLIQFQCAYSATSLNALQRAMADEESIHLRIVAWDDLLQVLESNDFFVSSLTSFVRDRFLRPSTFSLEELELAMDTLIPDTIQKIYRTVDRVRDSLQASGVATGRMSSSSNFYGFWITSDDYKFWFGYLLSEWKKYGTPFMLQRRHDWGDSEHEISEELLFESGFHPQEPCNYFAPVKIPGSDDWVGPLATELLSILEKAVPVER